MNTDFITKIYKLKNIEKILKNLDNYVCNLEFQDKHLKEDIIVDNYFITQKNETIFLSKNSWILLNNKLKLIILEEYSLDIYNAYLKEDLINKLNFALKNLIENEKNLFYYFFEIEDDLKSIIKRIFTQILAKFSISKDEN